MAAYLYLVRLFYKKDPLVRNCLLIVFASLCFWKVSAQATSDTFKVYNQSIPGSTLECKMVPIQGGTFEMGSSEKDKSKKPDETPQRTITISPFWMSAYETTRDAFDVFFKDETTSQNSTVDAVTRPSPQYIDFSLGMGKEGGFPVNSLSQYAALMYCRWLYDKTGIFYRLPTEAEWEYACRAGSTSTYFFGNDSAALDKYAWYSKNSGNKYQKVGQKEPNAWGLYDMLGNVSEWTLDHYDENYLKNIADNSTNPMAPANKAKYPKTLRGGSYSDNATALRVAARLPSDPMWNRRDPQIPRSRWWITDAPFTGFRIIRPLQQPTAEEANDFYKQYLGK
ncbi:formylglycine-generating enzyme family protein [Ilyomonas limi]|uniref:Formylglycine-generating enzyme family protein n=1 Tax=Ilyomonas limi TaxID=2575867 RepID=A0A4U3L8D7_9BACT|nr:formylglycine-generating enzyme family protein [Ilyomonas limi]TKK71551.1 formylglycine-generating enzyme family protein [Ilyomonas limi]